MSIIINKEKSEICILLNKRLYNQNAIKDSLLDFKEISEGEIKEDRENWLIVLKPKEENILDTIGYEFCNYVLGLMKNKMIV